MKTITIGKSRIGYNEPPYFIADIAANHDGDLNRALKLIELAKGSGAHAAKFQNFHASKIVSQHGFEALGKQLSHQALWKKPVFEVYKEASIPLSWTDKLRKKCDEAGIEYLTSPYDFDSVDSVDSYLHAYKVGSGDITWLEILEYIAKKGKPIIIATGASTMQDVERAIGAVLKHNNDIVLMQCNTNYTASKENFKSINLNVLRLYAQNYPGVILGLSDHTHGHSTVLGAVALGARVIEKHFTDNNNREGPDHKFAMNPATWKEMVERANELYTALGDGIKKIEENEKESAIVQRRSIRYVNNLKSGHVISKEDLFPLRPCPVDGILPNEMYNIVGKKLIKDVTEDDYARWDDISR